MWGCSVLRGMLSASGGAAGLGRGGRECEGMGVRVRRLLCFGMPKILQKRRLHTGGDLVMT